MSPDGRKYYHNRQTGTTTWEKPKELQTESEKTSGLDGSHWVRYTTPEGKPYYHNQHTGETSWKCPPVPSTTAPTGDPVVEAAPKPEPAVAVQRDEFGVPIVPKGVSGGSGPAEGSREEDAPPAGYQYATKAEAKAAFKELRAEKKVTSRWTWDQCVSAASRDSRFRALRTLPEQKQCFQEFQEERKAEDKRGDQEMARAARRSFLEMLSSSREVGQGTTLAQAQALFELDGRWHAIHSARERSRLLLDHLRSSAKREKEGRESERRARVDDFKRLLRQCDGMIKTDDEAGTGCRKVLEALEPKPASKALSAEERLGAFQEHFREILRREEEEEARTRRERLARERRSREAFTSLLEGASKRGEVGMCSTWGAALPVVSKTTEYADLKSNLAGSTPRELFEDFVRVRRRQVDLAAVRKAVDGDEKFDIGEGTTREEILAFLDALDPREFSLSKDAKEYVCLELLESAAADAEGGQAGERARGIQRRPRRGGARGGTKRPRSPSPSSSLSEGEIRDDRPRKFRN